MCKWFKVEGNRAGAVGLCPGVQSEAVIKTRSTAPFVLVVDWLVKQRQLEVAAASHRHWVINRRG